MLGVTAAVFGLSVAPVPALADSAPQLRSTTFSRPAVVGRTAVLRMRATDTERAVSGAVVAFAGEGSYGTSACRLPSAPRRRGTRRGDLVTLSVPHRFRSTGARGMLVRLDSGGCSGEGGALLQSFTVTPVQPGEPPQDPVPAGSPISILASVVTAATGSGTVGGTGGSGVVLPPGVTDPIESLPGIEGLPSIGGTTLPSDPTEPLPDPNLPLPDPNLPLPDPNLPLPPPPPLPPVPDPTEPLPDPTEPLPDLPLPRAHVAGGGCADADTVPTRTNLRSIRRATLCLINRERTSRGLRRVRVNRRMARAAAAHSFDMVARGYFAHNSPSGESLTQRLQRARWLPRAGNWSAGENIAFGETPLSTPRATVDGWMQSTGHRENNLDPAWRLAGIGVIPAVPGMPLSGATYTAVFGK